MYMCASVLVYDGHVEVRHLQLGIVLSCFSVLSLKFTVPTALASGNPPPLQSTCFCPIVLGLQVFKAISIFFLVFVLVI